jgi:hypothetical protein
MRVRILQMILSVAAMLAANGALAAGVGVRAGTTGIGADVAVEVLPTLSARLGYSYLSFSTSVDSSEVEYDAKPKLSNGNLFLDWSPLGPFRITAGLILNDNKVDVTGVPTGGTFTLNGVVYPAAAIGSLSGTVKSGNSAAPYLGIGYGNVSGAGVNFYFDLGVMFQGNPKATLTATCGPALPAAQCSQLQTNAAAEALDLQDSIKNFKYYPVASIGVTIGF